jgi:hypothetical protein
MNAKVCALYQSHLQALRTTSGKQGSAAYPLRNIRALYSYNEVL